MEDLILLLLQALGEFALEVFASLVFDWPARTRPAGSALARHCAWLFATGVAVSGISLWIHPHTVFATPALRIGNLVLAPVVAGYLSRVVGRVVGNRDLNAPLRDRFWQGCWFTLGVVLLRFVFAVRP